MAARLAATLAVALLAVLSGLPVRAEHGSIYEALPGEDGSLSTLKTAVSYFPDLVSLLNNTALTITVFAPNDAAFEAAGITPTILNALASDEAGLAQLKLSLLHHVLPIAMPPLSVGVVEPLDTQAGPAYAPINATRTEAGIFISSGDVTAEVLATLTFNTSVVHVINAVLPLVAANDGGTGGGGGEEEYETDATIVELLQSAELQETFSTLRAAVEKFPDVVTLLSAADGSVYSVFAPVNSAFTASGVDVDALTTEEQLATLKQVLLNHVVENGPGENDFPAAPAPGTQLQPLLDGSQLVVFQNASGKYVANSPTAPTVTAALAGAVKLTGGSTVYITSAVLLPVEQQEEEAAAPPPDAQLPPPEQLPPPAVSLPPPAGGSDDDGSNAPKPPPDANPATVYQALMATPADQFTTLKAVVAKFPLEAIPVLDNAEVPLAVFAPTDEAFSAAGIDINAFTTEEQLAALINVLLNHAVTLTAGLPSFGLTPSQLQPLLPAGKLSVFVDDQGEEYVQSGDVTANVLATLPVGAGSVIYVVNDVLLPLDTTGGGDGGGDNQQGGGGAAGASVYQLTVENAGLLGTLRAALDLFPDLVAQLNSSALQATVFAPTDEAFAAAGVNPADLFEPEQLATLRAVLLNHVVPQAGLTFGEQATELTPLLPGGKLSVVKAQSDGRVSVVSGSSAALVLSTVQTASGAATVHIIDGVLMPDTQQAVDASPPPPLAKSAAAGSSARLLPWSCLLSAVLGAGALLALLGA